MSKVPPRFGPYELLRRLGAGGMAETFVAVRRGPGGFEQHVCLKRILPAFEEDAEFVRLFLEEARIAARLRHSNVVQVLDFGVVDGSLFLALELVDGMDLRGVLDQLRRSGEAMTSGLVSHLAYELAAALEFAHEADADGKVRGVVHRDISPSNVLLSTAGEVKLTDFGIAKAMNVTHVTKSGNIKGKVPYMAPEYALRMEFDARSDLFSLGITLYEALVGRRPFDGVTELDTLRRIQEGEHVPVPKAAPGTPHHLADGIERLLASEPEQRFANATELLDGLVDVAPPPTARRILGELVRRCVDRKRAASELGEAPTAATPQPTRRPDARDRGAGGSAKDGTALLDVARPIAPIEVQVAPADAETRTRAPTGLDVAVRANAVPVPAVGAAARKRKSTVRGGTEAPDDAAGTLGGSRGTDANGNARAIPHTQIAPELADPGAIASAHTARLDPLPDRTPLSSPVDHTGPVSRRGTPPWVWVASVTALALLGIAGALLVASSGDEGETEPTADEASAAADEPLRAAAAPDQVDRPAPPARVAAVPETAEEEPASQAEAPIGEPAMEDAPPAEPRERTRRRTREPRPEEASMRIEAAAETERGTLRVAVVPYGDVWIDGRHIGTAPVVVDVQPGRHVVATGADGPTESRVVQVAPGQRREVTFR